MTDDKFMYIFQGGRRRLLTIPATAGNIVTNLTPGAGKRWLIVHGMVSLANGVGVANRLIFLQITNGTVVTHRIGSTTSITASQNGSLDFGPVRHNRTALAGFYAGDVPTYLGIDPVIVEGADQLRISIPNGLAADAYEGFVTVLEMDI